MFVWFTCYLPYPCLSVRSCLRPPIPSETIRDTTELCCLFQDIDRSDCLSYDRLCSSEMMSLFWTFSFISFTILISFLPSLLPCFPIPVFVSFDPFDLPRSLTLSVIKKSRYFYFGILLVDIDGVLSSLYDFCVLTIVSRSPREFRCE